MAINKVLALFSLKLIRKNNQILSGIYLWEDIADLIDSDAPLVLDIGANTGQTIEEVISTFHTPLVHSFEPSSDVFEILKTKDFGNAVHLYKKAMGEEVGSKEFLNYSGSTLSSFLELDSGEHNRFSGVTVKSTEIVEVDTVDHFVSRLNIEYLDLLKIDVQGFDLSVLKGAVNSINDKKVGHILIEINLTPLYNGQAQYYEILEFLSQRNFSLIDLYEKERGRNFEVLWATALFKVS